MLRERGGGDGGRKLLEEEKTKCCSRRCFSLGKRPQRERQLSILVVNFLIGRIVLENVNAAQRDLHSPFSTQP